MLYTDPNCEKLLSKAVLDRLLSFASDCGGDCAFLLCVRRYGDQKVQDMLLFSEGMTEHLTIMGVKPIELSGTVSLSNDNYVMTFISSAAALRALGRHKARKLSVLHHGYSL